MHYLKSLTPSFLDRLAHQARHDRGFVLARECTIEGAFHVAWHTGVDDRHASHPPADVHQHCS
jgi:hypothetical protein